MHVHHNKDFLFFRKRPNFTGITISPCLSKVSQLHYVTGIDIGIEEKASYPQNITPRFFRITWIMDAPNYNTISLNVERAVGTVSTNTEGVFVG